MMIEPSPDTYLSVRDLYSSLQSSMDALKNGHQKVRSARGRMQDALSSKNTHYRMLTSFGALETKRVSGSQLAQLQRNLVLSQPVGAGNSAPIEISKLILQLKADSLGIE